MKHDIYYLENSHHGRVYFTIEHVEEQFDGFDTVQPACLALRRKEADDAQYISGTDRSPSSTP